MRKYRILQLVLLTLLCTQFEIAVHAVEHVLDQDMHHDTNLCSSCLYAENIGAIESDDLNILDGLIIQEHLAVQISPLYQKNHYAFASRAPPSL